MITIETSIVPFRGAATGDALKDCIARWVARARSVGYDGFIIDLTGNEPIKTKIDAIRSIESQQGDFKIYTRKTLILDDRRDVKAKLSNVRDKLGVDVVCLRSSNPEVLNFTAKDSRIDIIKLETPAELDAFTEGIASLAGQQGIFIELPFVPLFRTRGASRSKYIHAANKAIKLASTKHARMLFSSDASQLVELKNAWQKAVVLALLLDMSKQVAMDTILKNPAMLVDRPKTRLETVVDEVEDDEPEVE